MIVQLPCGSCTIWILRASHITVCFVRFFVHKRSRTKHFKLDNLKIEKTLDFWAAPSDSGLLKMLLSFSVDPKRSLSAHWFQSSCGAMWSCSPAGNGKENTYLSFENVHLFFSFLYSLPLIQMILKVILRILESWFTAQPCHLNQLSQWSETKVQHQSEPRERAEPSGGWQLSFSGCDLGGGLLHCSPASSVLL